MDLDVLSYRPIDSLNGFLDVYGISDNHIRVIYWLDLIWHINLLILHYKLSCTPSLVLSANLTSTSFLATAASSLRKLCTLIQLDLHLLHELHIVLIFELPLEVFLDASIVYA